MSSTGRRRIAYVSGTRADFGLMRSTLLRLAQSMDVGVIVTGMHLDPAFGLTVREVEASGLSIVGRIPSDLSGRSGESMALAVADGIRGLTRLLPAIRPDALVLLGDRGEMLAGAIAALHLGVPTVHIHGGERSGTVDEPVRHAISKLSTYHFVATAESRDRLIRMGEDADRVFVTGAPGVDDLLAQPLPDSGTLRASVGLPQQQPFVLVVFHPVVQQASDSGAQTLALLRAVTDVGLPVLWLEPNADAGSGAILSALRSSALPAGSRVIRHLTRPEFLAAMRDCAVMVGNSSAGIIEAASFGVPVVNVGDRQRLRERGPNVTDVPCETARIVEAIRGVIGRRYPCHNLWGDGHAGERIASLLSELPFEPRLLEKLNAY